MEHWSQKIIAQKISSNIVIYHLVETELKAIYIYASERSSDAFSENGIVYYAMTYCFEDISG